MPPDIADLTLTELFFSLTGDKAPDLIACQPVLQVDDATATAVFIHPLHIPLNRTNLLVSLSCRLQDSAHILRSDPRLARCEYNGGQSFTALDSGLVKAVGHSPKDALCLLQSSLREVRRPISGALQVVQPFDGMTDYQVGASVHIHRVLTRECLHCECQRASSARMNNTPLDGLLVILCQRLFNGAEQLKIIAKLIN